MNHPIKHANSTVGFTLLEVMIAMSIFSVVIMMLMTLSLSMGTATRFQDAKITTQDEARNGMMALVRDVRQSANTSINWAALPGSTLTYRVAVDIDGNGYAVDVNGDLELAPVTTVGRDVADANNDGLTNQLVRTNGGTVAVLANDLRDDEDQNGNGLLDGGEDADGNGFLDQGIQFQQNGGGLLITIQTQRSANAQGTNVNSIFSEIVFPRN